MAKLLASLQVEFWWWLEQQSSKLWQLFCPADKASYWLDWLPAWAYRHRHQAERRAKWLSNPD